MCVKCVLYHVGVEISMCPVCKSVRREEREEREEENEMHASTHLLSKFKI